MAKKFNENDFTGANCVDEFGGYDFEDEDISDDYEPMCWSCNGTGEGKYEGETCCTCKGSGVIKKKKSRG